ncbi:MAG: hypothetical protein ACTHKV_03785 [Flavipsychrobacter sp.]
MKKFFQKIAGFFVLVFGGAKKFEKFLIEHVDDAIEIVTKIKQAVESPVVATLIFFLPAKYKAAIGPVLTKIESTLERVLLELQVSQVCLEKATTAERLKCFVDHLRTMSPAMQDAVYFKFASLYTRYNSDTQLKGSVVDAIVQNRFIEQKENIA